MASEDKQCQAVDKAMMRNNKAEDLRKETELMMKPYANWEEYLTQVPLSIALLGQLICISAGQGDFSINKNPPPNGYKYIKFPDSFSACLCQVSTEGWHAFNEAHINMDQIRLLTASIPGKIKIIVQTLFQEVEVVGALLPGQIKRLKSIAEQCLSRAVAVKDKYASVISLVQELLQTCINAKPGHEKELEEVKTAIDQTKIKEKAAEEAQALAEKHHKQLNHQIDELLRVYKKNMEKIPTGWEALGMAIVESLGIIISNMVDFGLFSDKILWETGKANVKNLELESTGGYSAMRNATIKVEQMLKQGQEASERNFAELKQRNQEMIDLLCKMESFKAKEIDFKDAFNMLTKGLKAMGKVKEQWEKMIRFFQMVSNLMNPCLREKIGDFLGSVEDVQGSSSHAFVKDLIYNQMFTASNVAHLVHMIAETYTEVSTKYLMDQVSSLGRLITLEPSDPEFETQWNALIQGCEETQDAILRMVTEKKEEYDQNIDWRQ